MFPVGYGGSRRTGQAASLSLLSEAASVVNVRHSRTTDGRPYGMVHMLRVSAAYIGRLPVRRKRRTLPLSLKCSANDKNAPDLSGAHSFDKYFFYEGALCR